MFRFALVFDSEWHWYWLKVQFWMCFHRNVLQKHADIWRLIKTNSSNIHQNNQVKRKVQNRVNTKKTFLTLTLSKILLKMPPSAAKANSIVLSYYSLCCPEPTFTFSHLSLVEFKLLLSVIVQIVLLQSNIGMNKLRATSGIKHKAN